MGWIIGPVLGYYLGLRSQRIQREAAAKEAQRAIVGKEKAEFGVFIHQQRMALPERGVGEFYDRTKPEIRDAVQRVKQFLPSEQRTSLDDVWKEYDQIKAEQLATKNEGAMGESMRDLHKRATPANEFKTPYGIVRHYLDAFYKFSANHDD